jgi:hypothetical protein
MDVEFERTPERACACPLQWPGEPYLRLEGAQALVVPSPRANGYVGKRQDAQAACGCPITGDA